MTPPSLKSLTRELSRFLALAGVSHHRAKLHDDGHFTISVDARHSEPETLISLSADEWGVHIYTVVQGLIDFSHRLKND